MPLPLTGSHTQVPWRGLFLFFPTRPFFHSRLSPEVMAQSAHATTAIKSSVTQSSHPKTNHTAFLTCLAGTSRTLTAERPCCLSCRREIGFRHEKGLHHQAGNGVWALVSGEEESMNLKGKVSKTSFPALHPFGELRADCDLLSQLSPWLV